MKNKILGIIDSPDLVLKSKVPPKPCVNQILTKENYLSEFLTKEDKRKVLENLGIYSIIQQFIEKDEISEKKFKELLQDYLKKEKEGDTPENVDDIIYINEDYPDVKTLRDALDLLLYKDLSITITISPQIAEKGDSVTSVVVTWNYNKEVKNQTLYSSDYPGGISIDSDARNLTVSQPITENRTFKISGTDGKKTVEGSVSIVFYAGIYYGSGIDQPEMSAISKTLRGNRNCTITTNAGTGQYIWIFLPQEYGNPTFTVNGFSGGFQNIGTIDYKVTKYNIWRSDNHSLGNTTINIS